MKQGDAREALWFLKTLSWLLGAGFIWTFPIVHFSAESQTVRAIIAGLWPVALGILYLFYAAYRPFIRESLSRSWTWVAQFWRG